MYSNLETFVYKFFLFKETNNRGRGVIVPSSNYVNKTKGSTKDNICCNNQLLFFFKKNNNENKKISYFNGITALMLFYIIC